MKAYIKRTVRRTGAVALSAFMALSLPAQVRAEEVDIFAEGENVYEAALSEEPEAEALYTAAESVVATLSYSETEGTTCSIAEGVSGINADRNDNTGITTVTISSAGSYTLTGEAVNTIIIIKKNLTDEVNLTLKNLKIDDSGLFSVYGSDISDNDKKEYSVIECKKGTSLVINLEGENTIISPESGIDPEATVCLKGADTDNGQSPDDYSLTFVGAGSLDITGSMNDAIKSKGNLYIKSGDITITDCQGDGIQAENVDISGGTVDITTVYDKAAESFYTSGSSSATKNTISGNDSTKTERVVVDTGSHKGIKAGTKAKTETFSNGTTEPTPASGGLTISGGTVKIDTTGTGIKVNGLKNTSGYERTSTGVYIIGGADDAIHSNNTINITGGKITVSSADDGITAAGELNITKDAEIDILTAYEGIEGRSVTIGTKGETAGPTINIDSNDDGINTAGKTVSYVYETESTDENYTKTTTSSSSGNNCVIYSGTVNIKIDSNDADNNNSVTLGTKTVSYTASGDGIDCNGSLDIEGGTVTVFGQSSGDNSPIDTNDGFTLGKSAVVLATGTDGMGESTPRSGDGAYIVYGSAGMGGGMPGGNGDFEGNMGFGGNDGNGGNMAPDGNSGFGENMGPDENSGFGGNMGPGGNDGGRFMAGAEEESSYLTAEATGSGTMVSDISADSESDTFERGGMPGGNGGFEGNMGFGGNMGPGGNSDFGGNNGNGSLPGGDMGFGGATSVSAGSVFSVANGSETLINTTLPYAASFVLYASPSLESGSSYTATVGTTSSTLTAAAPGTAVSGGNNGNMGFPGGDFGNGGNNGNSGNMGFPGGDFGNGNGGDFGNGGGMGFPGGDFGNGSNNGNNGNMGFPGGDFGNGGNMGFPGGDFGNGGNIGFPNGEFGNGDNGNIGDGQAAPVEAPAETPATPQTVTETETATKEATSTFAINGEEVPVDLSISYKKNITYTGKKINVAELSATPDISTITGAVSAAITNGSYSADDLFKVKYVIKNNKTAGSNSYFYAKIAFNNSAAKKAGIDAAGRKSVKAAVKAMNKELKTTKRCYFTIDPVDLSTCTASVTVKKLNSDGSVRVSDSGALKSIKSVQVTTADGTAFKLGSKKCSVLVLDSSTGEVSITGKGSNFTGTVTAYAVK